MTTIIKQLREAARTCSNMEYRVALQNAAIEVDHCVNALFHNPTTENMKVLNGVWAGAAIKLLNVPPEADPAPLSGSPEPTRFAMAA